MSYPIGNGNTASRIPGFSWNDNVRDSNHGDGGIDLEPHMENALESVVETIMLFGEYPQPKRGRYRPFTTPPAPKQFDLYDWILENNIVDPSDLREYFILSMNDHSLIGPFEAARSRLEKELEKRLKEQLAESEMVQEKAREFAEEEA